jgi:3',5'-cyclic AMP phosphodiesterase CpdA
MRVVVIAVAATLAACGDGLQAPPDDAGDSADAVAARFDGGVIALTDCGYNVVTRRGAERPRVATDEVGWDPTPRHVHLGIPGDPRTSIAITWRTRDDVTRATSVRFAAGDELPASALTATHRGFTFAYDAGGGEYPRIHEAHLCGLSPDTIYSYQVGSAVDGVDRWSPVYSFRTAPDVIASPDAEVRFAVVGDTRSGYDVWAQLVALLAPHRPDLVLFTGDAVDNGNEQREWEPFFERAEPLFARVPVVAANGNHDATSVHYFSQLAQKGDEENFGIDFGWAHISVINDTPPISGDLVDRIRPVLAADLAASAGARWKLAAHHRPMFSAGGTHGPDLAMQRAFMPLYDQYDVDLVLNGHEHDFEITHPMIWDAANATGAVAPSASMGTVFEVQGGGGAPLHANGSQFWTLYSESVHAASIVTVSRDRMTLEAYRVDGSPIATGYSETK